MEPSASTVADVTEVQPREFGHIRMRGGRYDVAGLPLTGADELRRYEGLIIKVAKSLFLREHPRRKRAPRGFEAMGELRLTDVRSGSVVPVLERPGTVPNHSATLTEVPDYMERSRRLINDAFRGVAAANPSVPKDFPSEYVRELAQFGRSLGGNEFIELSSDDEALPAVVSQESRKRLQVLANLGELEVERILTGQVTGLRDTPQQFDLALSDGSKMTGTFVDPETYDELQAFLGRTDRAPMAAISVVAMSSLQGKLLRLTDVLSVEAALPPAWAERIQVLSSLQRGWLTPDSPTIDEGAISNAEQVLLACVDEGLPRPRIYPTPDGGVLLEWAEVSYDLEVEFAAGVAYVRWVSLETEDEDARETPWSDVDSLIEILEELRGVG